MILLCVVIHYCFRLSVPIACFTKGALVSRASVKVGTHNIEYKKHYEGDETELQFAVEEHMYPPAISLQVVHSKVPDHLQTHKRILFHIHGAKEGVMNFPIDFFEEKQGMS